MANYPGTMPSATPATHGEVLDEVRAIASSGRSSGTIIYASGLWCNDGIGGTTNHTPAIGSLVVAPYAFPPGMTIVGLADFLVTVQTSAVRRLGIYADTGSYYPGSLLIDAGTSDASTGVNNWRQAGNADFSAVAVGGIVWMGGASQVAATAPTVGGTNGRGRGIQFTGTLSSGSVTGLPANNSPWDGYSMTGVTGALPSTFSSTRTVAANAPRIAFKIG